MVRLLVTAACATAVAAFPSAASEQHNQKKKSLQAGATLAPFSSSFSIYGEPVELKYGEAAVRTTCETPPGCYQALPADVVSRYANGTKKMAITRVTYDIVKRNLTDGTESSVPMWHVYNHHSAAVLTGYPETAEAIPLAIPLPFWTRASDASGGYGEWDAPYRQVVPFPPSAWYLQYHMIKTHKDGTPYDGTMSKLHQCPCTPQRVKDMDTNTIDGIPFHPGSPSCNDFMAFQTPSENARSPIYPGPNTGCLLATFIGGEACCSDGMLVVDTALECTDLNCTDAPTETFYFKSTFYYEDASYETMHEGRLNIGPEGQRIVMPDRPLYGTQPGVALYAAQFSSGGDYSVTACPAGTPTDSCANNLTWIEPLKLYTPAGGSFMEKDLTFTTLNGTFKVIKAYPHAHTSIREAYLWNAKTGELLCALSTDNGGFIYGTSKEMNNVGNENDYCVAQSSCDWSADDAPKLEAGTPLKMTFFYNAALNNTGVMATWFFDVMPA